MTNRYSVAPPCDWIWK